MKAARTILEVLPLLSVAGAVAWNKFVYRSQLKELRRAYANSAGAFPDNVCAWSCFRVTPDDPTMLRAEKERIIAEVRKKNRFIMPLFFGSVSGLAILSIVLESVLHL
jgi:hypothetical protein